MKSHRRSSKVSSPTTVIYAFQNDHITPTATVEIPIEETLTPSPSPQQPTTASAAARIQSAYRSHRIRGLYKTISSVDRDAGLLQSLIQRQETVDAIRTDDQERLRMNEALMSLLLKLDSVPGSDLTVREARRKVSRRIVGMQEILDSISDAKDEDPWWWCDGGGGGAWPLYWEEAAEENICREKGGDEMERFCAQYLGFRCFQRFLRE